MNNYSKYGLPSEVQFCKNCCISNQRPNSTVEMNTKTELRSGIYFDENGVCDACNFAEHKKAINWNERSEKFYEYLARYRKNNGDFDVIVPSSGGKDSSFTAHILKYKYDMNPLAVTWAPSIWTEVGRQNFDSLTRVGGVDSILVTPNGRLHSLITKLAFKNLGHPFQPFIHGQKVIGPKIAKKMGIDLVVYGENQAEYGNPIQNNNSPFMDPDFFTCDDPKSLLMGGFSVSDICEKYEFCISDFANYIPLSKKDVELSNIQMTYLGYFEKWDPQEVYYYAEENTGFRPSPTRSIGTYSTYTELDDLLVPVHFYTMYIKFGLGRASYDASQEIRNGHIDRDEAEELVRMYDGEITDDIIKEFVKYINISEGEFHKKIDEMRSPHLWEIKSGTWRLKRSVYDSESNY